jgi:hypothetical protein
MIRLIAWLLSQPLFYATLGVVGGPVVFVRGFRLLQRKRLILDTPRSTVRSAALGPVEISGKAVGPYTLVAPLSQDDCLYYRLTVESNPKGDLKNKKMQELCAPLFVDDGTGRVMIWPQECELQLDPYMGRADYGKAAIALAGIRGAPPPEFSWERSIKPGDEIFVMGTLQENRWGKWNPNAEVSELSRVGPGFVSQGEADLLRHERYAALDPTLPSGCDTGAPGEFDLHPPMILMKGKGPFVISAGSERDVVLKLQWKSMLYIWGGPLAALWGLWEIFTRAKVSGMLPADF